MMGTEGLHMMDAAGRSGFAGAVARERVEAAAANDRLSLMFAKKKRVHEAPLPLVPIADTHAHLLSFWGKDPAEALARAALAGDRLLVTLLDPIADGMDASTFRERLDVWVDQARGMLGQLEEGSQADRAARTVTEEPSPFPAASLLDNVRYLCGVHPYGAPEYTDAVHAQVEAALDDPSCMGIGEIGLDYHFDRDDDVAPAPHELQIEVMERQLDLAVRHNVPVELHLRHEGDDDARTSHRDAYDVLRRCGIPDAGCVLHCFGEDRATMECFVELGCHIAFGGAATFKRNEGVREAFAACPLDRVLLETDCPYMSPEPLRGLECEPAMITFTADALIRDRADRTGEDAREIAWALWENAWDLFSR